MPFCSSCPGSLYASRGSHLCSPLRCLWFLSGSFVIPAHAPQLPWWIVAVVLPHVSCPARLSRRALHIAPAAAFFWRRCAAGAARTRRAGKRRFQTANFGLVSRTRIWRGRGSLVLILDLPHGLVTHSCGLCWTVSVHFRFSAFYYWSIAVLWLPPTHLHTSRTAGSHLWLSFAAVSWFSCAGRFRSAAAAGLRFDGGGEGLSRFGSNMAGRFRLSLTHHLTTAAGGHQLAASAWRRGS